MRARILADRHDIETDRFLLESELALRWRISPRTLQRWRQRGRGPAFLKVGQRVIYPFGIVLSYEDAALVLSGEAS